MNRGGVGARGAVEGRVEATRHPQGIIGIAPAASVAVGAVGVPLPAVAVGSRLVKRELQLNAPRLGLFEEVKEAEGYRSVVRSSSF